MWKKLPPAFSFNLKTVLRWLQPFGTLHLIPSEGGEWAPAVGPMLLGSFLANERRKPISRYSISLKRVDRAGLNQRIAMTASADVMEKAASAPR